MTVLMPRLNSCKVWSRSSWSWGEGARPRDVVFGRTSGNDEMGCGCVDDPRVLKKGWREEREAKARNKHTHALTLPPCRDRQGYPALSKSANSWSHFSCVPTDRCDKDRMRMRIMSPWTRQRGPENGTDREG